jgi:hypothetical protein
VVYNCVVYRKPDEGARRNKTALILYKQALASDDRKTKPIDLTSECSSSTPTMSS